MDRIQAFLTGAAVAARWAARRGAELLRCVGNLVASTVAALALEGVQQTEPVPDLVRGGLTLVEVVQQAARDGEGVDAAAVLDEAGAVTRGRGGEVAVLHRKG